MHPLRWLLCVFALSLPLPLQAADLQLYTEDYPPLNFSRAGQPAGLGVEVVEELLKRTGHTATISVVPWARGYQKTLSESNSGLFVTMRTAEREKLFKWVGPIAVAVTSIYALKGSGLTIHNLDDAGQLGTIAVPRQWYSYQTLQAKGLTNLYGVLGPKQMMTMLRHRRVPLVVADNLTLPDLLALGGLHPGEVDSILSMSRAVQGDHA